MSCEGEEDDDNNYRSENTEKIRDITYQCC